MRAAVLPLSVLCVQCGAAQKPPSRAPMARATPAAEPVMRPAALTLPPTPQATRPATEPLTDAQIAAVLAAINQSEIAQAHVAGSKSADLRVDELAAVIITLRSGLQTELASYTSALRLEPENSDLLTRVTADADDVTSTMTPLTGADFDVAYLDGQIREGEHAIDVLDTQLIPEARAPEIKRLGMSVRWAIRQDLDAARALRRELVGTGRPWRRASRGF